MESNPIVGFVVMIGLSIMFSLGQNTYESEEYDLVVIGFEDLLTKCNSIHSFESYNSYIDHHNSFIDEYGEFNKSEGDTEIVSTDYQIAILIEELIQCENKEESRLINYGELSG